MNQNQVNANLENLLGITHQPTVDKSQPTVDDDEGLKNILPKIKKGPGGKRPGAGRKLGSVNKIQGGDFLEEYRKVHGNDLKEDLARDMFDARHRGDYEMLFKYQTAFAKYYFSDVAAQDITSGGQPLGVQLVFTSAELPEWQK